MVFFPFFRLVYGILNAYENPLKKFRSFSKWFWSNSFGGHFFQRLGRTTSPCRRLVGAMLGPLVLVDGFFSARAFFFFDNFAPPSSPGHRFLIL